MINRKIFACILSIMMVMQVFIVSADSTKDESAVAEPSEKYISISDMGIFPKDMIKEANAVMSGTEFADIIDNMLGYDASSLYSNIRNVVQIKCVDVVKVFIDILGYEPMAIMDGGYPVGYFGQGLKLHLLNGVNLEAGEPVTYDDFTQIMYNTLNVELLETSSYNYNYSSFSTDGDRTFLSEILKLKKVTGCVVANGYTDLDGGLGVGKQNIKIGNKIFEKSDNTTDADKYLGYYVVAYYHIDENVEVCSLASIKPDKKYDIKTIDAADIVKYDSYTLYYDGGSKGNNYENISRDATVIYNGSVLSTYTNDDFNMEYGNVVLIKSSEGVCETVIITAYKDFLVSGIDTLNNVIYNKIYTEGVSSKFIDYDDSVLHKDVSITNKEGKPLLFSDIKVGNALSVAESDRKLAIIVSDNIQKEFTIKKITVDEDIFLSYGDNMESAVSKAYLAYMKYDTNPKCIPKIGSIATMYINAFGKIAYMTVSESTGSISCYIMKVRSKGNSVTPKLEIKYIAEDGVISISECADKITIYDKYGNFSRPSLSDIGDKYDTYTGLATLDFDGNNNIKSIAFPLNEDASFVPEGRTHMIAERTSRVYKGWQKTFGGKCFTSSKLVVFTVPNPNATESDYTQYGYSSLNDYIMDDNNYGVSSELGNDNSYICELYGKGNIDFIADTVVVYGSGAMNSYTTDSFVVTSITDIIKKDVECKMIKGVRGTTNIVLYADYIDGTNTAFDLAYDFPTRSTVYTRRGTLKVVPGDIVRCNTSGITGFVTHVNVIYKCDQINPAYPNGQLGNLSGTTGIYDPNKKNGNPYAISSWDLTGALADGANSFADKRARLIYGWVYDKYANCIIITTQDLSTGDKYLGATDNIIIDGSKVDVWSNKITLVDYSGRIVKASSGSYSNIVSYKDADKTCTRVIAITNYGDPQNLFILKN